MKFKTITEAEARELILTGKAGYWELSLRDSISKTPIAHPEQTVVFLRDAWHLVPKEALMIHDKGRVGDESANCHASMVEVNSDELQNAVMDDMAAKGKHP